MFEKSAWMRWGVCALTVVATIAVLGGCAKKEDEHAETTETTTETMTSPMAGTYAADAETGRATLTLNADNTAMMSMQPMDATQPASVMNGTWAEVAGAVDVTFQHQMGDSTMSMTLNFAASGDTLRLTNAETAGVAPMSLVKQH